MSNQIQGFRLSPQQMRLWPARPDGRVEAVQCRLLLEGPLRTEALGGALRQIVERHEILRTTFHHRPGIRFPIQVTAESGHHCWTVIDLKGLRAEEQDERAAAAAREDRQRPFDHEHGPLLRASLLELSETKHLLLLTLPALCADSWTLKNLFQEVAALYEAEPGAGALEEPTQYVQFSEWQNQLLEGEEGEAGRAFWHERAAQAAQEPPPHFVKKGAVGNESEPFTFRLTLEPGVARRIESVAAECGATAADLLLCCWQILLWRAGGRSGVAVGVSMDGREFEEVQGALGAFNRWLPVGCHFEPRDSFAQVLGKVGEAVRAAYAWQDYYVADEVFGSRNGHAPLPVRFEFEEWPAERRAGGVTFSFAEQFNHADRCVLKLGVVKHADSLILRIDYDAQVDGREAERMGERLLTLLEDALGSPRKEVGRLAVVGTEERRQLDAWSRGPAGREPECVHRLFERQARRTPDAAALRFEGAELSYAELDTRSNHLARRLRALGVGPDVPVGILMERSIEMVVSVFAVLKAGGAYVPLDPGYPAERVRFMLEDSRARVLLTQSRLRESVTETALEVVCVDTEWQGIVGSPSGEAEGAKVTLDNLAYVIYTSGSTGRPKGVMMTHRGLGNYLGWCTEAYAVAEGRGTLVHTPLGFDLTVTSLFPPLLTGRHVTLLPEEHAIDELSAALSAGEELSLVKITPAQLELLAQWLADKDSSFAARAFVIGGEALHWNTLSFWRARAPQARLVNEYGPTETAIGCCVYEADREAPGAGVVPIGRPIAATELYLLDEHFQPVPIGAAGELYIGGDGLARGYLGRPGLTAERFVAHPFGGRAGARLYKTGDLARYLPDGELEFLSRSDGQVKLRGFRVELGEVECVLKEHPAVRDSIAAVREDVPGDPRLVAYWVAQAERQADDSELRSFLRERLPHYMVPSAFMRLEALPLTANGKVDRRALPAPETARPKPEAEYVKPRTEVESTIVSIWQEMLRVERVGVADNFFDLGGHSMLMVQLHSRLRASLDRDIPIIDLFGHPTISSLAEYLSRQDAEETGPRHSRDRADHQRASAKRQKRVRQHLQKQLGIRDS